MLPRKLYVSILVITGCAVAQALYLRRHIIPMGASRDFLKLRKMLSENWWNARCSCRQWTEQISDFFPAHLWRSDLPTDFDAKWLKRRAFTQGWYFCSKNRNFSYPLISRAPKTSKFRKFLDLENFRSIWPLPLEVQRERERTPLILHWSSMKVT